MSGKNQSYQVTVKADGRKIEVYKLKEGYPSPEHVWCNLDGCTETFKKEELEF